MIPGGSLGACRLMLGGEEASILFFVFRQFRNALAHQGLDFGDLIELVRRAFQGLAQSGHVLFQRLLCLNERLFHPALALLQFLGFGLDAIMPANPRLQTRDVPVIDMRIHHVESAQHPFQHLDGDEFHKDGKTGGD